MPIYHPSSAFRSRHVRAKLDCEFHQASRRILISLKQAEPQGTGDIAVDRELFAISPSDALGVIVAGR